jgi:acylphosphatase
MPGGDVRTVQVRIAGRVQGVGYRYWTERVAGELGLSGWVRNRRDGTVEAVFSGAPDDVAEMLERCRAGPSSAQVTSIDVVENVAAPSPGFDMLPTA